MPEHRLLQIDAFTRRPFGGNPAAVIRFEGAWPDDAVLVAIANENNLSETAFVRESDDGSGSFDLRWFTPTVEMQLCGHATLATAHALFEHHGVTSDSITFNTRWSGTLTVERGEDGRLIMDFPAIGRDHTPVTDAMTTACGLRPTEAFDGSRLMLVFETKRHVLGLNPTMHGLSGLHEHGVIVTAPGTAHDFVSRFFAPNRGVNEDPVTGSAHCMLAPYWAARLKKQRLTAHQVSKRSGELWCEVVPKTGRVRLEGFAVTVLDGVMRF